MTKTRKMTTMRKIGILFFANLIIFLLLMPVYAQALNKEGLSVNIGVKVIGANREGDNQNSNTAFESDSGGQVGFSLSVHRGRLYAGASLQSGTYQFDGKGPDQVAANGVTTPVSDVGLKTTELNLIVGYYFWKQVSLFAGLKGIEDQWDNNTHRQNFNGVGLGISGFHPINARWDFFGSLSFVPLGRVKTNGQNVGEGKSTTLEAGMAFYFTPENRFSFGLKFSSQKYDYDSGDKQNDQSNSLFVAYSRHFLL